jgi:PTS system mannose-specific IID component
MQGVGFGYATLPLLEPLQDDPERYRAAVSRASECFNAHPYLAGVAVGAAARAEVDGVPGATVQRLKTALAGPLGSLGDQLFWIGVVPAVMASSLTAVGLGAGAVAITVGVVLYLTVRILVTAWGLRLGYRSGLAVANALKASRLADQVRRVGLLAGGLVGCSVPIVGQWLAGGSGASLVAMAAGAAGGTVAALIRPRVPSARLLTLAAMAIILLWHWSQP